ncbi:ABC transporter permease [Rhodoplanes sp. TEM]|uniref:ABC transporter permease n=1 Tax=Rhodoplanes tepidamans TaxID=200616 RepID=A0ABT5JAI1_RHOTP|nr:MULTISPECIES: ABC transporter permease [Rhodoplanes]MDC7786655.1 ABC transporter permease [Rhodoplanes tepidamans]MDC7982998.1 ABC transporter permease [Rhodoplanes sp. TEM]MDQ0356380.1 phospholipid/cholesterol/gamma-HCH transport system permease protein [Rhodoplanes tepidamans]
MSDRLLDLSVTDGRLALAAAGSWTADRAGELERLVETAVRRARGVSAVEIRMGGVERLDTFGAWLLERLVRTLRTDGRTAAVLDLPERWRALVDVAHAVNRTPIPRRRFNPLADALARLGETVVGLVRDLLLIVQMFGELTVVALRTALRPWTFRFTSTVHHLDRVGWRAVPVILLMTFLIGCIIAQQGLFHFRRFGVETYVVDMVGILVLREIGVLMVAIMVAGRSGSAYTAELGSMKMREETDALRTMGFDPLEVLVLPRVVALVIALPALTFVGSMAALYGAGLVAWLYGGMSPDIFLSRLHDAISIDDFAVGMIKAPFMALVIGAVASVEGLEVKGSTESLGLHTTASVVKSIFLMIGLDGLFAMFFATIGM